MRINFLIRLLLIEAGAVQAHYKEYKHVRVSLVSYDF